MKNTKILIKTFFKVTDKSKINAEFINDRVRRFLDLKNLSLKVLK